MEKLIKASYHTEIPQFLVCNRRKNPNSWVAYYVHYEYWIDGVKCLIGSTDPFRATPNSMIEVSTGVYAVQTTEIKTPSVEAIIKRLEQKLKKENKTLPEIIQRFNKAQYDLEAWLINFVI